MKRPASSVHAASFRSKEHRVTKLVGELSRRLSICLGPDADAQVREPLLRVSSGRLAGRGPGRLDVNSAEAVDRLNPDELLGTGELAHALYSVSREHDHPIDVHTFRTTSAGVDRLEYLDRCRYCPNYFIWCSPTTLPVVPGTPPLLCAACSGAVDGAGPVDEQDAVGELLLRRLGWCCGHRTSKWCHQEPPPDQSRRVSLAVVDRGRAAVGRAHRHARSR
jgi:hypothetical protein